MDKEMSQNHEMDILSTDQDNNNQINDYSINYKDSIYSEMFSEFKEIQDLSEAQFQYRSQKNFEINPLFSRKSHQPKNSIGYYFKIYKSLPSSPKSVDQDKGADAKFDFDVQVPQEHSEVSNGVNTFLPITPSIPQNPNITMNAKMPGSFKNDLESNQNTDVQFSDTFQFDSNTKNASYDKEIKKAKNDVKSHSFIQCDAQSPYQYSYKLININQLLEEKSNSKSSKLLVNAQVFNTEPESKIRYQRNDEKCICSLCFFD